MQITEIYALLKNRKQKSAIITVKLLVTNISVKVALTGFVKAYSSRTRCHEKTAQFSHNCFISNKI